jgi:hypothetical protein|tara:strand:+ start:99 stop:692 length:594 start_codon:yes stop_codon:yes gene_type:complete
MVWINSINNFLIIKTMKIFKYALLAIPFLYFSCNDDDDTPAPINEEEVITTMTIYLENSADASDVIMMQTQDLDGDGPNEPVITVDGPLSSGSAYIGAIGWANEMEDPAENITLEILEEADEHQVFFNASGVDIAFEYGDFDSNNNPLGVVFSMSTGNAGSGTITITLVHEPTKPNDGLDTAGGSIDIQTSFPVTIE